MMLFKFLKPYQYLMHKNYNKDYLDKRQKKLLIQILYKEEMIMIIQNNLKKKN